MHVYFSGIGGAGMAPLAMVAHQAGHSVSGSDKQDTQYLQYLKKHGIRDVHVKQRIDQIKAVHEKKPIDWFVYSSAVMIEDPEAPEFRFCRAEKIKMTKRDEFLNQILDDKKLQLIAIAGTHGKTTTTAMVVWLFRQLHLPISYLLPAKTSFADMGAYDPESQFFVYECDEFDRNFLAFKPHLSLISGVSWDHHEIFPTREDYQEAFREFISQSDRTVLWQEDFDYLQIDSPANLFIQDSAAHLLQLIQLKGVYNRLDAWLAIQAVHHLTKKPLAKLLAIMNEFPGLQRRMEQLVPNLYTDYAHTPEKVRGAMSVALEMAEEKAQNLVVIYEPLTNRRQHYMMNEYQDVFDGAVKLYWVPSYLAREDPAQRIIPPEELISHLSNASIAEPADLNHNLRHSIEQHLEAGDMVVAMAGGGGGSLDEWLRKEFLPEVKV